MIILYGDLKYLRNIFVGCTLFKINIIFMDNQQSEYSKKYEELELLGRGNYGSAYVVRANPSGRLFVAKKMNLDGMSQAEIEGAKEEVEILKKFSDYNQYPFIVKYIESFSYKNTLVIVMEFCEYGDLATFIKHAKKKGELLDEKVILAWLLMLVLGVQALHSKNVLHRDLKSANVFLTSTKFVRIGDFGISKVLDSTSAKTFVGTPYYLSPQVCSNKKYDLRSDWWSLGCILYQLCTLNYPFQANNILSLAMKITSQEVAPIPSQYSKQLNDIVMGLLTKDQNKRLSLQQILLMPYIMKFIEKYGNNMEEICDTIPLKRSTKIEALKSNEATIRQKTLQGSGDSTNQDTMKTIKSSFEKTSNNDTLNSKSMKGTDTLDYSMTGMSPKDQMKMRKEKKIREEQEALMKANKQYYEVRNFAKSKKQEQFGGSGSNFGHSVHLQAKTLQKRYQEHNRETAEQRYNKKNGLNDKQSINLQQLSQVCDMTQKMNGLTIKVNNNNSTTVDLTASVERKIIAANENYKVYTEQVEEDIGEDEELQEYYDEEFQVYESQEDKADAEIQNDVFKSCLKVLTGQKEEVSPSKLALVEKAFETKPIASRSPKDKKEQCIKECIGLVKQDRFKLLYQLVSQGYVGQRYVESEQLKQLRTSGSPSQKKALKLIDLIKYYEMEQRNQ